VRVGSENWTLHSNFFFQDCSIAATFVGLVGTFISMVSYSSVQHFDICERKILEHRADKGRPCFMAIFYLPEVIPNKFWADSDLTASSDDGGGVAGRSCLLKLTRCCWRRREKEGGTVLYIQICFAQLCFPSSPPSASQSLSQCTIYNYK